MDSSFLVSGADSSWWARWLPEAVAEEPVGDAMGESAITADRQGHFPTPAFQEASLEGSGCGRQDPDLPDPLAPRRGMSRQRREARNRRAWAVGMEAVRFSFSRFWSYISGIRLISPARTSGNDLPVTPRGQLQPSWNPARSPSEPRPRPLGGDNGVTQIRVGDSIACNAPSDGG